MGILKNRLGILLFLVSLVISLFVFKDYGVTWDEQISHLVGETSYNYLVKHDNSLYSFDDRFYGVGFELPLIVIEKALSLHDARSVSLMRHLVTHIFFLFSAFILFILIDYLYHNKFLAAAGFLMLVLNPVLYAHSFFNSKDIPFMAMFTICFLLTAVAFKKGRLKYFALLGIACGLLLNIRLMGILLIMLITLRFGIDFILSGNNKKENINRALGLLTFLAASTLTLYITWPYLWVNPFQNFISAYKTMANFPWQGQVLFLGERIKASELPWYYSVAWFLISNPILYLCYGAFGLLLLIFGFIRRPFLFISNKINRNHLMYFLCFAGPILVIIILRSTLYDSWRQLFFIYTSFILLAVYGLNYLLKTRLKVIIPILTFIGFGSIAYFMISNHPFQQVYFNRFVPRESPEYLRKNFELDYWGSSYKADLEYILATDTSNRITFFVANYPGYSNRYMLKQNDRKRLEYVNNEKWLEATYFITNYRYHPEDYEELKPYRYHSFKVFNSTIIDIFKSDQIYEKANLSYDAVYHNLPPDKKDTTGREEYIRKVESQIRNDSSWYEAIRQKAKAWNKPIDTVIHNDAIWLWDKKQKEK